MCVPPTWLSLEFLICDFTDSSDVLECFLLASFATVQFPLSLLSSVPLKVPASTHCVSKDCILQYSIHFLF